MFEINLLDKTDSQMDLKKKPRTEIIKDKDIPAVNDNKGNYILNSVVFLVLCFFIYIVYNNNNNNEYFYDISPGNILSLIYSDKNQVIDIKTDRNKFTIIKDISDILDVNKEQSYYDSLLNTKSYVSVKENSKKIYFIYNWYNHIDDNWNIEKLYDVMKKSDILTSEVELFENKIIMVSEYNEMINLFNILKSLNVLYIFKYKIELFENKMPNINYYKILISPND